MTCSLFLDRFMEWTLEIWHATPPFLRWRPRSATSEIRLEVKLRLWSECCKGQSAPSGRNWSPTEDRSKWLNFRGPSVNTSGSRIMNLSVFLCSENSSWMRRLVSSYVNDEARKRRSSRWSSSRQFITCNSRRDCQRLEDESVSKVSSMEDSTWSKISRRGAEDEWEAEGWCPLLSPPSPLSPLGTIRLLSELVPLSALSRNSWWLVPLHCSLSSLGGLHCRSVVEIGLQGGLLSSDWLGLMMQTRVPFCSSFGLGL